MKSSADPPASSPRRTGLLALGVALLLAWVLTPLWREPEEPQSTYGYTPSGHRAFLELLERLPESRVERWKRVPQRLSGRGRALFLLEPFPPLLEQRREYTDALLEWVEAGNTLVLAPGTARVVVGRVDGAPVETEASWGGTGVDGLLREVAPQLRWDRSTALAAGANAVAVDAPELAGGVHAVWLKRPAAILEAGADGRSLVRVGDATIAAEIPWGSGWVVVVPPELFHNGAIGREDNAVLAWRLARHYGPDGVLIDEFFHGLTAVDSLMALAARPPLGLLCLQLGLCLGAWAWARGVRFGTPQDPPPASRRAKMEQIEAMGEVLRRGHKPGLVLSRLRRGLIEEIRTRYALQPQTGEAETARYVESVRPKAAPGLRAFLDRTREIPEARPIPNLTLVAWLRDIHRIRKEILE